MAKRARVRRAFRGRKRRRRMPRRRRRRLTVFRNPIPKTMRIKFKYSTLLVLDPGVSTTSTSSAFWNYRANSLYDPDQSGIGHQPLGFDQYMPFYNRFTVIASKIQVTCISGSNTTPVYFSVSLEDSTSAPLPIDDEIENGQVSFTYVSGQDAGSIARRSRGFSARRFFGKRFLIGDPSYSGTISNDPAIGAYFQIAVASVDGMDPDACRFRVLITYLAVLNEPKDITGS